MADPPSPADPAPAVQEALQLTLSAPFEDVVPYVQLEHELVGFETVSLTRLDRMIEGALGESAPRTAVLVTCHAEVARDAVTIDPRLGGFLPCTTLIYERPGDDRVHLYHVSATTALRDLGGFPADAGDAVEALVDLTGEYMAEVWANIESHAGTIDAGV